MFSEDDLLPLSAIQHILFCERQCALIHLERLWQENPLTAEGRILHERADEKGRESRGDIRIVRGLEIRSLRLGLAGIADVVEFRRANKTGLVSDTLVKLPDAPGLWKPFPVEYKRGKPKPGSCDEAQLCAQAICLEEMLNVRIDEGALFYHSIRRRTDVIFDDRLRSLCEQAALKLRELMASQITPPAVDDPRCEHCSLIDLCSPGASSGKKSAQRFIENQIDAQSGKKP
jgi:CRISPR-associated exonuclease Cas4